MRNPFLTRTADAISDDMRRVGERLRNWLVGVPVLALTSLWTALHAPPVNMGTAAVAVQGLGLVWCATKGGAGMAMTAISPYDEDNRDRVQEAIGMFRFAARYERAAGVVIGPAAIYLSAASARSLPQLLVEAAAGMAYSGAMVVDSRKFSRRSDEAQRAWNNAVVRSGVDRSHCIGGDPTLGRVINLPAL